MPRTAFRILAAVAAVVAACQAAVAENRVALVIGNSGYQSVTALPNPENDAKAMAELLTSAGFEVVSARDLTQGEMRTVIGDFAARVAGKGSDTVALVFYAGHGLQVDGDNYLVPIDAKFGREADVPLQAVRLGDLMNALAAVPSKSRVVILDACRNNPFSEINKTTGRGLAIVDAPTGSIVVYSTSPGAEAEDGTGANSPFTTAMLTAAREPGLPVEQAFKRVRLAVHQATEGRQTPWDSSSLTGDFFFFPGQGGAGQAGAKTTAQSAAAWRQQLAKLKAPEAYELVIREDVVEAYEAFLGLYGAPPFGPRVRSLLERRKEMVAWYAAVTINTVASYQAFLASYPNSDLAATARRLLERSKTRSLSAAAGTPPGGGGGGSPQGGGASPQGGGASPQLVNVAPTGPMCPCTPPPEKRKEPEKQTKKAKNEPPPRRPKRMPTDDDVFGPGNGPPSSGGGVAIPVQIGIGGFGGGGRRPSSDRPSSGTHYPTPTTTGRMPHSN